MHEVRRIEDQGDPAVVQNGGPRVVRKQLQGMLQRFDDDLLLPENLVDGQGVRQRTY